MGDDNNGQDNNNGSSLKLFVLLIGMGSAALVVAIYHFIAMGWCNPRRRPFWGPSRPFTSDPGGTPSSIDIEHSAVQLIPVHKYQKGEKMLGEDGTCAICLSEFEEGEELRTLPECSHSFHAPCIDMWLYSHFSCPMCRADATPSPQIFRPQSIDADREETIVLEHVTVQSHVTS